MSLKSRRARSWLALALLTVILYLAAAVFFAPQLLFFAHHREVSGVRVYSEKPLSSGAPKVIETSNAHLRSSALFSNDDAVSPIFLTEGGWRWKLLSLGSGHAFAFTRPSSEAVVVNRSDLDADRVWRGSAVAGERSLSAVIAHERTHTLIRKRFGLFADRRYPRWLREGYCDFVAGSSTLSDEQAASLRLSNPRLPALRYYDARRRVAAILASNGGSVQSLFYSARSSRKASGGRVH